MSNNYDFLFKFIIIGDSSIKYSKKVSESHVFYWDIPKEDLNAIMSQLSEYNLDLRQWISINISLKLKYGIQYYL